MPYYSLFCDETFSKDYVFCPSFRCFLSQLRQHWLFPSWLKVKGPHLGKCVVENSLTFSISKLSPRIDLAFGNFEGEEYRWSYIRYGLKRTYFIDYMLSKPKAKYTSMHFARLLSGICFNGWCTNCKMECMSRTSNF